MNHRKLEELGIHLDDFLIDIDVDESNDPPEGPDYESLDTIADTLDDDARDEVDDMTDSDA